MLKSLKQARATFSLLNPSWVRRKATRAVHIGLVAPTPESYAEMERFLLPNGGPLGQLHRASDRKAPAKVDLVLYAPGVPTPDDAYSFHPDETEPWMSAILDDHSDLDIALARQFPVFRAPVVERIIQEVSRENALFALATAVPNIVPNLIELPWAIGEFASDTAFLTANQVRMAFLIASACGRDAGFSAQKGPLLAIAGGAFGWRALARELVGKIPLGGGLIPKGAIAYAGTYLAGKGLETYYLGNRRFTRAQREVVYQEAYQRGRGIVESISRKRA